DRCAISGRPGVWPTRFHSVAKGASRYTATARLLIKSQLSSSITTPPPRATTVPGCRASGSSSFSSARNLASLWVAKTSAIGMPTLSSTIRSRSAKRACARWATSAPTRVLSDPMKPSSASGRLASLDAARIGRHLPRRGAGSSASLLRLDEDLVAEIAGHRQVIEHLRALGARGVDLHTAVADQASKDRLPRRAVLHAVDRDDLLLAVEDPGLDRDPLICERVQDGAPADPHDDEPQDRERYHRQGEERPQPGHVEVVRVEHGEVGEQDQNKQRC